MTRIFIIIFVVVGILAIIGALFLNATHQYILAALCFLIAYLFKKIN